MRRALGMLAALALAACQVDVEGAKCSAPGTRTECPEGQACGNDNRCSERAAACQATLCEPGATRCAGGTDVLQTCTNADPVCGSWTARSCVADGLLCAQRGESPHACECPPNTGAVFTADPVLGSASDALPYPTGLDAPRECRFRRLGDGLAAAVAHGGAVMVRALGASGEAVSFGAATGETFPLVIPEGVTLVGASAPGQTTIQGDAASAAKIFSVQGGTVERLRVANVSMTGDGVELSCGAGAGPTLRDVAVSGAQTLAKGVTVAGDCAALLERVDVSGATGPALEISVPATASVTARGSRFHTSGLGVRASGGIVRFESQEAVRTEMTDNIGEGALLDGTITGATTMEATFADVVVARNGGTGLRVNSIPQATSKLTMTSCDVHSNGTASPTEYGIGGRRAGGILLSQVALASFSMQGNKVYGNHGSVGADELAFESSSAWPLTTGGCGPPSPPPNAFGCVKDGSLAVSVWPGTVDARSTIWPVIPPTTTVSLGVNATGACNAWAAACP